MSIKQRFVEFEKDNPDVYVELVAMARKLKAKGHTRLGIRMLWETLRYTRMVTRDANSDYKLNDHYPSRYARLIMACEPDLDGIFEVRDLRA